MNQISIKSASTRKAVRPANLVQWVEEQKVGEPRRQPNYIVGPRLIRLHLSLRWWITGTTDATDCIYNYQCQCANFTPLLAIGTRKCIRIKWNNKMSFAPSLHLYAAGPSNLENKAYTEMMLG